MEVLVRRKQLLHYTFQKPPLGYKIALVDEERGIKKQTYWDFFENLYSLKQNVERNDLLCISDILKKLVI